MDTARLVAANTDLRTREVAPSGRLSVVEIRARKGVWTEAQLLALPALIDAEIGASIMDMGLTKARQMIRDGSWPTRTIHSGDRWLIPTRPLLALLGIEDVAKNPAA
ncbi:hypothetical protein I6A62_04640 [Frankia sp. AgW1.1]|nr:hypothetical protein [Frankia sp. AgB1.9]MBL7487380.1 hypothetical protein [Frankia sp. AgW1.1]MBL7618567.1 hypothetical protein [Frankia sp. AgB1.8]